MPDISRDMLLQHILYLKVIRSQGLLNDLQVTVAGLGRINGIAIAVQASPVLPASCKLPASFNVLGIFNKLCFELKFAGLKAHASLEAGCFTVLSTLAGTQCNLYNLTCITCNSYTAHPYDVSERPEASCMDNTAVLCAQFLCLRTDAALHSSGDAECLRCLRRFLAKGSSRMEQSDATGAGRATRCKGRTRGTPG